MSISFTASHALMDLTRSFLAHQTTDGEIAVLAQLNLDLTANHFAPLPDGFIEWASEEHGVIDIFAFHGQQVIRIDPLTMDVVALAV